MNKEKVKSVVAFYQERLAKQGISKNRIDPKKRFCDVPSEQLLAHAHYLSDGVLDYLKNQSTIHKAHRHLTAMQMCLSFAGWYTLEELMNHNRPS